MRDRFALRLVLLGIAVFAAVALWRSWPELGGLLRGTGSDATSSSTFQNDLRSAVAALTRATSAGETNEPTLPNALRV